MSTESKHYGIKRHEALPRPTKTNEMKPLFLPLKTEYYRMFESGGKTEELRKYGPRWNEKTCVIGREIILSLGYGKGNRLQGTIVWFKRQHGSLFESTYRGDIQKVFGTLDIDIACISIGGLKAVK